MTVANDLQRLPAKLTQELRSYHTKVKREKATRALHPKPCQVYDDDHNDDDNNDDDNNDDNHDHCQ